MSELHLHFHLSGLATVSFDGEKLTLAMVDDGTSQNPTVLSLEQLQQALEFVQKSKAEATGA